MKRFILIILWSLALYVAGGFIVLDCNVFEWSEASRTFYVWFVFTGGAFIAFTPKSIWEP